MTQHILLISRRKKRLYSLIPSGNCFCEIKSKNNNNNKNEAEWFI